MQIEIATQVSQETIKQVNELLEQSQSGAFRDFLIAQCFGFIIGKQVADDRMTLMEVNSLMEKMQAIANEPKSDES